MNTSAKGRIGEAAAAEYLEAAGYHVIARNVRTPRCELDLVATIDREVVFIDVKSWRSYGPEPLEFSIDARKRSSIVQGARLFLKSHAEYAECRVRFDVMLHRPDRGIERHVKHAFTESG